LKLAGEVVGYRLLGNRLFERVFDEFRGFLPAEELKEHDAGEDDRAGVDHVLVGVLGRGAVGGFEDRVAVADVGSGGDAETTYLRGGCVGDVVAVKIAGGENAVVFRTDDDLLKDRVGDAIVDEELSRSVTVWSRNS
jgi:hypothetical protein